MVRAHLPIMSSFMFNRKSKSHQLGLRLHNWPSGVHVAIALARGPFWVQAV